MPILTIRHVTSYHYRRPVTFGEHRMMLRPRDDADQKVIEAGLAITPGPSDITWTQDCFGNHVAVARFSKSARELRFESSICVAHTPAPFRADDIRLDAKAYPFAYAPDEKPALARFLAKGAPHEDVDRWAAGFLDDDGSADTHALLVRMTQTIRRTFRHGARHQKGTREPGQTLALRGGSCRDLAVLMISGLRSLGIAARFVSGYLHLPDDDDRLTGGNTHAWVQAFVPGVGWVDFDPSSGAVGNENLVRVAAVHEPREAIPLAGTFNGKAADHLGMKVAVKVASA